MKTWVHQQSANQALELEGPVTDGPRTLVLVFGPSNLDGARIGVLRERFGASVVVGCSTAGEIHGPTVRDDSIVVAATTFEHTDLRAAHAVVGEQGSFEAGRSVAEQLVGDGLCGVFVLSDGLVVNGSELVRGLCSVLPDDVIITGGLAGDGDRFAQTWTLVHGAPTQGVVTAVGLYGDRVRIGHGSKGGWDVFGPLRTVTRSAGNVLYELDGKPALALYKRYLGELADGLPGTGLLFPLEIRRNLDDEHRLVRTILAVDEATQSMTFAGDIPEGWQAQLMRAHFDRLVTGAVQAAEDTGATDEDTLSIAISCVGRRLVLGERAEEELEGTLDVLPQETRQIGFYSYGEISPVAAGTCDLHNQTMTLTTLSEV